MKAMISTMEEIADGRQKINLLHPTSDAGTMMKKLKCASSATMDSEKLMISATWSANTALKGIAMGIARSVFLDMRLMKKLENVFGHPQKVVLQESMILDAIPSRTMCVFSVPSGSTLMTMESVEKLVTFARPGMMKMEIVPAATEAIP